MATGKIKPIGRILLDRKRITAEQLQEALLQQQTSGIKLGQILIRKGYTAESSVLEAAAEQYGLAYIEKLDFRDAENIFRAIPANFLRSNRIVPFDSAKGRIKVAINDISQLQPVDDLKMIFRSKKMEIVIASESEIQRIINTHFETIQAETTNEIIENLEESDFEILSKTSGETADLLDTVSDAPIIKLVNTIIRQAVLERASDIHFEVYEKEIVIRFRIDGVLYKMFNPPKKFQDSIISRIKIMANLNIAENRLPQDGRIHVKVGGKEIDIRVSIFPTYYGERIVLRLLNKSDMNFDLSNIGFSKKNLESFNKLIDLTHGILLVTGPTGSGKSTTLYSVLAKLNSEDVNILTVEDPIEYQLFGISQMQIKPGIGLTFAAGLRSILRQDPDIVMIGEIRDLETAEIAVQAALTGHRVFSTLHTNDAPSGITRLADMGIEPYLITSAVNAFLAQRLARRICLSCVEPYKPTQQELSRAGIVRTRLKKGKLYRGKGCEACLNTGYSGRIGIFELLIISDEIKKLIMAGSDASTIREQGLKEGMVSLLDDGINKVIEGVTTLDEVLRVC
jgi:general secretion pathway protein E